MKALVFHGPGQKAWEDAPKPTIVSDTDAIVPSTPSRSAAPICTSSRVTFRR